MCKDPISKQIDSHKDQDSDIFFGRGSGGNTTLPTIIEICYLEAFKADDSFLFKKSSSNPYTHQIIRIFFPRGKTMKYGIFNLLFLAHITISSTPTSEYPALPSPVYPGLAVHHCLSFIPNLLTPLHNDVAPLWLNSHLKRPRFKHTSPVQEPLACALLGSPAFCSHMDTIFTSFPKRAEAHRTSCWWHLTNKLLWRSIFPAPDECTGRMASSWGSFTSN